MSPRSHPHPTHAVVIGAGLGGLAAAQALSRHVERVTLLERDDLPTRPASRAGVPQGRHLQVLQPGGLAALEDLLPGVGVELRAGGAVPLRAPEDLLWMTPAGWVPRFPAPARHVLLSASRELIEWTVRRRVLESPQVLVRAGLEVTGLTVARGRVGGVALRSRRAGTAGPTVTIDADLVVDASGRRSPATRWLAAAGYAGVEETTIDSGLAYATRVYRRTPHDTPGWKAALLQGPGPHAPRTGSLFPIEADRWMLTMTSAGGDEPPTDDDGFLAFARSLRAPDIGRIAARAEPLGPITGYRRTEHRRRYYERMRHAPDGFVVIGDAGCALNPVYGQGMSAAAVTAVALERCLARHMAGSPDLTGFSALAQRAVAGAGAGSWMLAPGIDLRFPGVRGDRRSTVRRAVDRMLGRYMDRVGVAATVDAHVNAARFDVIALLAGPSSLLRPSVAARVLRRHPPPGGPPAWPEPMTSISTTAPAPACHPWPGTAGG
jgi:2-polyprenyl-6-methoxyphenol hydroxylase-like FAD-dependent oxidoreductase